ncbi:hypothetical protein CEXT_216901 [Caerostris extrusa]|uniref:Uncharacterized protein n=1 Tax=Caerostris extrusa TaxID=172846 RepID=A0AAV4XUX3_CAEEX|nr:hypothetical protein CEXT_216901 [Caerostris extrusa]
MMSSSAPPPQKCTDSRMAHRQTSRGDSIDFGRKKRTALAFVGGSCGQDVLLIEANLSHPSKIVSRSCHFCFDKLLICFS